MKKVLTYALPVLMLFAKTGCNGNDDNDRPQGKRAYFQNIQVANPETVDVSQSPQFKQQIIGYNADPMVSYIRLISLTRFYNLSSLIINDFLNQIETLIAINPNAISGAETIYFRADEHYLLLEPVMSRAVSMGFKTAVR